MLALLSELRLPLRLRRLGLPPRLRFIAGAHGSASRLVLLLHSQAPRQLRDSKPARSASRLSAPPLLRLRLRLAPRRRLVGHPFYLCRRHTGRRRRRRRHTRRRRRVAFAG